MPLVTAGDALGTQHLNGFVLIPTLHALLENGMLTCVDSGEEFTISDLDTAAFGAVLAAFRTLALAGLAALSGSGAATRVRLNEMGTAVAEIATAARPVLADTVQFVGESPNVLEGVGTGQNAGAAYERFAELAERMASGWHLPVPDSSVRGMACRRMRIAFDGTLACPVIAALGMARARILPDVGRALPVPWRGSAVETVLVSAGLATKEGDGARLTEMGAERLACAADYGVIVSYAPVLADLAAWIGGRTVRSSRFDTDLSRSMNIWGSSGHKVLRRLRGQTIRDALLPLFDTDDLDSQPAGVADTGCGSGIPLRETVELIVGRTRRGRHLAEYPLLVVGGDISSSARTEAEISLHSLSQVEGVRTVVLEADVGDPDSYDALLREHCTGLGFNDVGLADLVHLQMFLLHDRELQVHDVQLARDEIRVAFAECSQAALADALLGETDLDADRIEREFTVDQCDESALLPALVAVADLVRIVRRWRPYLRHGLILGEAHVPRLSAANKLSTGGTSVGGGDDAIETEVAGAVDVDPAPAVWGVHSASGQFLLPCREHELAMVLSGLVCAYRRVTGTGGVSMAHWVRSEEIYLDHLLGAVPNFAIASEVVR